MCDIFFSRSQFPELLSQIYSANIRNRSTSPLYIFQYFLYSYAVEMDKYLYMKVRQEKTSTSYIIWS